MIGFLIAKGKSLDEHTGELPAWSRLFPRVGGRTRPVLDGSGFRRVGWHERIAVRLEAIGGGGIIQAGAKRPLDTKVPRGRGESVSVPVSLRADAAGCTRSIRAGCRSAGSDFRLPSPALDVASQAEAAHGCEEQRDGAWFWNRRLARTAPAGTGRKRDEPLRGGRSRVGR